MLARNLLHAVLLLILSFVGIAGFFLLLSAEFMAMAQVIIYVGAVAVLVLFAILLTPHAGRDNGETRMAVPALLLSLCLLAVLMLRHSGHGLAARHGQRSRALSGRPRRGVVDHMGASVRSRFGAAHGSARWGDHAGADAAGRSGGRTRMSVGIDNFLIVGAILFCIGLFVALSKRNAIGVLMGVELMLNAVNLTLITFSRVYRRPACHHRPDIRGVSS